MQHFQCDRDIYSGSDSGAKKKHPERLTFHVHSEKPSILDSTRDLASPDTPRCGTSPASQLLGNCHQFIKTDPQGLTNPTTLLSLSTIPTVSTMSHGNIEPKVDMAQPTSVVLRVGTIKIHEEVTKNGTRFIRGELAKDEYIRFLMMLWHIYKYAWLFRPVYFDRLIFFFRLLGFSKRGWLRTMIMRSCRPRITLPCLLAVLPFPRIYPVC